MITGKPSDLAVALLSLDKDKLYDLKEHEEPKAKRSLSANNYFYALCTKIAEKLRVSLNEIHNQMLARYGYPEYLDDKIVYFILPDRIDPNKLEGVHLKATSKTQTLDNGELNRVYIVMRGSHTYNTVEFTRLMDGVISEAKELDIETITDQQKKEMLERWGIEYEKHNSRG